MPGRSKLARKKATEEEAKSVSKLKRFGLQMRSQKCLQIGHNKRSCKNEAAPRPPKRKIGRPRTKATSCPLENELHHAVDVGQSGSSASTQVRKRKTPMKRNPSQSAVVGKQQIYKERAMVC
ncbi:multidrug and toxin extrusion protein 1 [Striga asiatica]|uniref:Multidrug and toxin extrusion protein 1 n=1 Tax=Striga asiatica TaxID=4170 RepID=A0A5A7QZD0_STRAF|nr:multidrug and toxin extrusion protein 1 [Striga asiatica]